METLGIIGFIFGLSGLSMGIMAKEQIENLKIDVKKIKEKLNNTPTQEK